MPASANPRGAENRTRRPSARTIAGGQHPARSAGS